MSNHLPLSNTFGYSSSGFHCNPTGQSSLFKHSPHLGPIGKQICCPNPTSIPLTSFHLDFGSHSSKAFLVSSGVLHGRCVQPSLPTILCTCESTPMPTHSSQAEHMQRYAIFGPTPFNCSSSFTVRGMSQSYLSLRTWQVSLMYLTFTVYLKCCR